MGVCCRHIPPQGRLQTAHTPRMEGNIHTTRASAHASGSSSLLMGPDAVRTTHANIQHSPSRSRTRRAASTRVASTASYACEIPRRQGYHRRRLQCQRQWSQGRVYQVQRQTDADGRRATLELRASDQRTAGLPASAIPHRGVLGQGSQAGSRDWP